MLLYLLFLLFTFFWYILFFSHYLSWLLSSLFYKLILLNSQGTINANSTQTTLDYSKKGIFTNPVYEVTITLILKLDQEKIWQRNIIGLVILCRYKNLLKKSYQCVKMTKMSFPQYCRVSWIRKSVNTILHKTKMRRKGI